jgi:SPP1 gp7 family putative phage head morphogenesis protein
MARRRKNQDLLTAILKILEMIGKAFVTLLIAIIKTSAQIFSELVRLLRKKPHTIRPAKQPNDGIQTTVRVGTGRQIYEGLKEEHTGPTGKTAKKYFLDSCAQSSITSNLSPQLLNYIRSENLKGRRAESIANSILRKLPGHDKEDVERMVRTVVGMAETAFDRARAQELGLDWYMWESSHDERVRESHCNMTGVLVSWNDPPSPEQLIGETSFGRYHPGGAEDCRCIALPVLRLDAVQWPAKVYTNGKIVNMSRKEFQRLSGIK